MAIQQVAVNICIGLIRQINFICEHMIKVIHTYIKLQELLPQHMQKVRKNTKLGKQITESCIVYNMYS